MKNRLYPGIAFSPQVTLADNIGEARPAFPCPQQKFYCSFPLTSIMYNFPPSTPKDGETILYTAKTEDALSGCQRGIEGAVMSSSAVLPEKSAFFAPLM